MSDVPLPGPFTGGAGPTGGVVITPAARIADSVKIAVADALRAIPDDAQGALFAVATRHAGKTGVNLVLAKRGESLAGAVWIGKTWGEPVEAGIAVRWTF